MYLFANEAPAPPPAPVDVAVRSAPPSQLAGALNALLPALWKRTALTEPSLQRDALRASAERAERLDDFGDETGWVDALDMLLGDLASAARLNPLGRTIAHGQIVRLLRTRLRAQALWRAHPDILERPIEAPVIVLGQMRSGTTRMHRLLACDPRFAHTRFYETMDPLPSLRGGDFRSARAHVALSLAHRFNPALATIHPVTPGAAEEDYGLLAYSFVSAQFEAQWRAPRYARWCERSQTGFAYQAFKRLLQTIGWVRGDAPDKRWVLKAPQFMQDLPSLLSVFPDAVILRLARDPAAVVASSASLVWNGMRIGSNAVDAHWVGREWLRKTVYREKAARHALADAGGAVIDCDYERIDADWQGEMARCYAALGLDLSAVALSRMTRFVSGARRHRGHRYRLEDFGLDQAQIANAFRPEQLSGQSSGIGTPTSGASSVSPKRTSERSA